MKKRRNIGELLKKAGMAVLLVTAFMGITAFRNFPDMKMDLIFPIPSDGIAGWDIPQEKSGPEEDPRFDEFLFYENDVYNNGIPKTAVPQPAGFISGGWKYCLTFNRTIPGEERIDEIGLAEVSFDGDQAKLILHPRMIRYGSHVEPEDDASVGYVPFTGTWEEDKVEVAANGTAVTIGTFYSYEGKDYALGSIIVKETGLFGDVLLVRP